jgi:hypothetical protein
MGAVGPRRTGEPARVREGRKRLTRIAAVAWLLSIAAAAFGSGVPDPGPFDAVLQERARGGGFDYAGISGPDRKRLAAYEASLADASLTSVTADERKAFYINAYNVFAIQTLLDHPGKSIRHVWGAFHWTRHRVGGQMVTLDDIENRLRDMKDARIHFAIVCASKSCPPLAMKAYVADKLSETLDRQGREFVNDPAKNVLDRAKGRLALSKIFDWNRREFERDAGGSLLGFVSRYVKDPATAAWVASYSRTPEFLEYDWSPNQP